jgi:hypothetical protein
MNAEGVMEEGRKGMNGMHPKSVNTMHVPIRLIRHRQPADRLAVSSLLMLCPLAMSNIWHGAGSDKLS